MNIKSELMIIKELAEKVKKSELILVDDFEELKILYKWRQSLNPFIFYGYNHGSCYSFTDMQVKHNSNQRPLTEQKPSSSEKELKSELNDGKLASVSNSNDGKTLISSTDTSTRNMEPYYIENFELIINNVRNSDNRSSVKLFSKEDHCIIEQFRNMCVQSRMLYVRLFQRKRKWIRVDKIQYEEIKETNMTAVLEELCNDGMLYFIHNLPT